MCSNSGNQLGRIWKTLNLARIMSNLGDALTGNLYDVNTVMNENCYLNHKFIRECNV